MDDFWCTLKSQFEIEGSLPGVWLTFIIKDILQANFQRMTVILARYIRAINGHSTPPPTRHKPVGLTFPKQAKPEIELLVVQPFVWNQNELARKLHELLVCVSSCLLNLKPGQTGSIFVS